MYTHTHTHTPRRQCGELPLLMPADWQVRRVYATKVLALLNATTKVLAFLYASDS